MSDKFLTKVSLYVRRHEMSTYFFPNRPYMSHFRLHIYLPHVRRGGGGGVGGVLHALK